MKLSTKLQFSFIILGSLVSSIAIISIVNFNRINHKIGTIYDDRLVPLKQLKSITDQYIFSGTETINKTHAGLLTANQAIENIDTAQAEIRKQWQSYKNTFLTDEEKKLVQEIEPLLRDVDQELKEFKIALENSTSTSLKDITGKLNREFYKHIEPLLAKLQELIDLQLDVAAKERAEAKLIVNQMWAIFIPTLGLTLVFILVIRVLISKAILATLKYTIHTIASGTNQIATATEQHRRIAQQQALAVNKISITLNELEASAQQAAQQAENSAAGAQQVLNLSHQGNEAVRNTLAGMSELKIKVGAIAQSINRLNEQLSQINNYQKLVSELANQTNILALNAAIESVRSGVNGEGFGVVATEIRKLADESRKSAHKINGLVVDIQTAIKETVQVTQSGIETVENGTKITEHTAEIFRGVLAAIDSIVISSQQISLNVNQQASAITEVVNGMNAINQSATETSSGISQTQIGTEQLNETALKLQEMV